MPGAGEEEEEGEAHCQYPGTGSKRGYDNAMLILCVELILITFHYLSAACMVVKSMPMKAAADTLGAVS